MPGHSLQLRDERPAIRQRREQIGVREDGLHFHILGPVAAIRCSVLATRCSISAVASRIWDTALATPSAV